MTTHYVSLDQVRRGRKSIAICGDWCDAREMSNEPNCPSCVRELALTSDDKFGPESPGTAVNHHPFDPFEGYAPKGPK